MTAATIGNDTRVSRVRPIRRERRRWSQWGCRCPGYDSGSGVRLWRALDIGPTPVFVEAAAPRVTGKEHGVVVERVPWARPASTFTRTFEAVVGGCGEQMSKTAVAEVVRVACETVGAIPDRVVADAKKGRDLLDGPVRIGIDEASDRG